MAPTNHLFILDYECTDDEYRCSVDGFCLERKFLCDGITQCSDGEDETEEACGEGKDNTQTNVT